MRLFGPETQKAGSAGQPRRKRPDRRRSPAGINCRWEFFKSRSSPSAPDLGAAIIFICIIPRDPLFFLPRPHNMAKTVGPLTVNGLAMSVAREFDERIDMPRA